MKIREVMNRRMLICAGTGFASGLPLFLLLQLVQAWLSEQGVSLVDIGLFTLVGLPYTWKFLWSPIVERYQLPFLGRRRGWLLVTQVGLIAGMASLGFFRPADQLMTVAVVSVLIAVFSATQDIVIDAYRRELLPTDEELAMGNSIHVQVYRIAGFIPGSLGFVLADHLTWQWVFIIMAGFMSIGLMLTLLIREANPEPVVPPTLRQAAVEPFVEYLQRRGWVAALAVLAFLFFYKLGDSMATALSTKFYLELGFSMTQIGLIAKNAGLWPMLIGGILGGLAIVKIGINRGLWLFGIVQLATIFGFVWLAESGNNPWILAVVIAAEYLGVGLGTAAFVTFIARETSPLMAATQFALFSAITAVPRTLAGAATGAIVETAGWTNFFVLCAVLALPGMLLLIKVAPWSEPRRVRLAMDQGTQ